MIYSLESHGDELEKYAFKVNFFPDRFSSYELFWKKFIVPLTNRPNNILFKSDEEIVADGLAKNIEIAQVKICIAELHYSVLANILVAWDVLNNRIDHSKTGVGLSRLHHCFSSVFTANDIAIDLVIRFEKLKKEDSMDAWDDLGEVKRIRDKIIRKDQVNECVEHDNITRLREYRNRLVHGRLMPGFRRWPDGGDNYIPRVGRAKEYLDWRRIARGFLSNKNDFQKEDDLISEMFGEVICHLDSLWIKYLLSDKPILNI